MKRLGITGLEDACEPCCSRLRGFSQMPQNQNVSQLISLERSQKQKHFGTSFIKSGTAIENCDKIGDFETNADNIIMFLYSA